MLCGVDGGLLRQLTYLPFFIVTRLLYPLASMTTLFPSQMMPFLELVLGPSPFAASAIFAQLAGLNSSELYAFPAFRCWIQLDSSRTTTTLAGSVA